MKSELNFQNLALDFRKITMNYPVTAGGEIIVLLILTSELLSPIREGSGYLLRVLGL